MLEFFNTVFSPANVISSGLLMLVVVYWITVMLGAIDLDFLDFDIDIDGDVDMDADIDQGGLLWLNHILTFFNQNSFVIQMDIRRHGTIVVQDDDFVSRVYQFFSTLFSKPVDRFDYKSCPGSMDRFSNV